MSTFGKYQILERIASGGMAEVYRAKVHGKAGFQRPVAIKIVLKNLANSESYVQMLVDEAKVAGTLNHPNIVQIFDLGEEAGEWFIAMELIEGYDLARVLKRAREKHIIFPIPHAVYVAYEILKGLEYAHARTINRDGKELPLNLVHRDVSPSNILLSQLGEVKLTDFGIAQASLKVLETVSGVLKGKYDYMSPEQATGETLDGRSDLFTVGVVLYEMLTGEHPFRADNEMATINRIRTGRYTPVSQRNPDIPMALEAIVDRSLNPSAANRYADAAEFRLALDAFFQSSGFIFTQSGLEQYLKGLFPELRRPKSSPVVHSDPNPLKAEREPTSARNTEIDSPRVDDHSNESELVTVVQKSPFIDETDSYSMTGRVTNPDTSPVGSLTSLASITMAGLAAFGGGLVGIVIGLALSLVLTPDQQPAPPTLQVNAPPRTAIHVDGDAVSRIVNLTPGTTHEVEITTKDHETWTTSLKAEEGREFIITIVEPQKLKPTEK